MEELNVALKSIKELKSAVLLISKELDRIESNITLVIKNINLSETLETLSQNDSKKEKPKNTVVNRIEDTEENLSRDSFRKPEYDIRVVGLGIEKFKE